MKKLVLAAALTGIASFATAGGMSEPVMEAEPVMEEMTEMMNEAGSSNGLIIPLIILALIAAAA
ncbi:MAG: hypothetical protein AAF092_12960 [Pseudomonadota bacterium]